MHSATQERRRKFYGWGYEGDEVSPQEIAEFEKAWTRLIGASDFTAVPFPTEDSINLRPSRVKVSASLEAICTTDKYDRLPLKTSSVCRSILRSRRVPADIETFIAGGVS
jgi:alkyldihydroxyacetonephosphate synthase